MGSLPSQLTQQLVPGSYGSVAASLGAINQALYQDWVSPTEASDNIPWNVPAGQVVPNGWQPYGLNHQVIPTVDGQFPPKTKWAVPVPDGYNIIAADNAVGYYHGVALYNPTTNTLIIANNGVDSSDPTGRDIRSAEHDNFSQAGSAVNLLKTSLNIIHKYAKVDLNATSEPQQIYLSGHSAGGPLAEAQAYYLANIYEKDVAEHGPKGAYKNKPNTHLAGSDLFAKTTVVTFDSIGDYLNQDANGLVLDANGNHIDIKGNPTQDLTKAVPYSIAVKEGYAGIVEHYHESPATQQLVASQSYNITTTQTDLDGLSLKLWTPSAQQLPSGSTQHDMYYINQQIFADTDPSLNTALSKQHPALVSAREQLDKIGISLNDTTSAQKTATLDGIAKAQNDSSKSNSIG